MDENRLESLLANEIRFVFKEQTVSTNDDAKALARIGNVPVLVVAETQLGGRGRRGNGFVSPLGGIYMSLVAPFDVAKPGAALLTSFAAACACEAVEEVCGIDVGIKWVNDLYVGGRKLAGILVESVDGLFGRCAVVGIGINGLVAPDAGSSVRATCLADHVDAPDLELVCAKVASKLLQGMTCDFDAEAVLNYCRKKSVLLQRDISFDMGGMQMHGVAADLDEVGQLVVDVDGQQMTLSSATCNVRLA